jgi:predicted nucleotidyltransferase
LSNIDFASQIEERVNSFKNDILKDGVQSVLSKHVLSHGCSILGPVLEERLRNEIAMKFKIDIDSVVLVGSAKLGFSPKPGQYFKPFSDASDLDIAIVSPTLFAKIWSEVFQMEAAGEYFDFSKFKHYHFKGWIRPDKLPSQQEYATSRDWWEFFNRLSIDETFMRMKVRAGLYFDEYFLRQYQVTGLTNLHEHLLRTKR